MREAKVIALANQKGGVGKTATAVNLGIGLVRMGCRVLVIDADPQGSLTISLGQKRPDDLEVSLSTLLRGTALDTPLPIGTGILTHAEGVDYIPANIELAAMEMQLVGAIGREAVLKETLAPLKARYDFILIDCMPSLGMITINALCAADSAIIPTQPSFLSTKGLGQLMSTIARVRRQLNPALTIDGVLLTMVDSRTNNAKSIIASLRETGDALRILGTEIPQSVRMAETSIQGRSIFAHDPKGKAAVAYEALTKEVMSLDRQRSPRPRSERGIR